MGRKVCILSCLILLAESTAFAALRTDAMTITGLSANECVQTDGNKLLVSTGSACGGAGAGDINQVGNVLAGAAGTSSANDVTFGHIQSTNIGFVTPGEATFTSLRASSTIHNTKIGTYGAADATFLTIDGTTIVATKIGTYSPSDATFTDTTITGLTASKCVETNSAGKLVSAAAACGSGGAGTITSVGNISSGATGNSTSNDVTFGNVQAKIGSVSPQDASFTSIITNGSGGNTMTDTTFTAINVSGTIFGSKIGTYSAADATFTTATASNRFVGNLTGAVTGNASTATALAANGSNCSSGSYPLGVSAAGAAESCTDATTEIDSAIATHAALTATHGVSGAIVGTTDSQSLSNKTITASTIGSSSAADGTFTSLRATGTIFSTKIGVYGAADATFTDATITGLTASKCVETNSSGKLVSAAAACGSGGSGDITDVGNIASGAAGQSSANDVTFGNIQATRIGSVSSGDATFTTAIASVNMIVAGQNVCREDGTNCPAGGSGDITQVGNILSGAAGTGTSNDVTFGNIQATKIGSVSTGDASFTTIRATGTIAATKIGTYSPADATFTAVSVSNLSNSQCVSYSGGKLVSSGGACGSASGSAVTDLTAITSVTATDLFYIVDDATTSNKITGKDVFNASALDTTFLSVNAKIGRLTANDATFTDINVSSNIVVSGLVDGKDIATNAAMLNETETISANWVNTANPWADNEVANTLTLTGSTINSTTIGASSAADATFTGVTVTGTISNSKIGAYGAADATFTGLTVTGTISSSKIGAFGAADATFTSSTSTVSTIIPVNVAVNSAGKIAVDTTADDFVYYGAATRTLPYKKTKSITIESPTSSDTILMFKAPFNLTITNINCIVDPADSSETVVIDILENDGNGDSGASVDTTITCANTNTADDGSLSNAAIDSGDWVSIDVGTVTGTVTQVSATVTYIKTSE